MEVIVESKAKGIKRSRTCELLQVEQRRVRHWFFRPTLADTKPGPVHAPHALLPEERQVIVALAVTGHFNFRQSRALQNPPLNVQ
jgi:hypothetical protein